MTLTFNQVHEKYFKGLIGISKLRNMVRQGQIPTVNISGRNIFFDSDTIENG